MNVDLNQLSEPKKDFTFTFSPDLDEEAVKILEPVKVAGKLKKGIAQVDVRGAVTAENSTQDKEAEIRGDDLEVAVYEDERIDLSELAREQILLHLPTQTFCRADCKGLCPKCKVNRNLQNCGCEEKDIDPRWAKLKDLKR
jgi:uncharacterized metal-binding protein YceD (DUF177 family)